MPETLDPLFGSGVARQPVLCALCGTAWDTALAMDGAGPREEITLCPSCLLTTSHGEPFPE